MWNDGGCPDGLLRTTLLDPRRGAPSLLLAVAGGAECPPLVQLRVAGRASDPVCRLRAELHLRDHRRQRQDRASIAPGTYQVQITTPVVFADVDLTGTTDMTACKSFVQFQLSGPGSTSPPRCRTVTRTTAPSQRPSRPAGTTRAQDNNQPSVAHIVFSTRNRERRPRRRRPTRSTGTGTGS